MPKFYISDRGSKFPLVFMAKDGEVFYALKDNPKDPWEYVRFYDVAILEDCYEEIKYKESNHAYSY